MIRDLREMEEREIESGSYIICLCCHYYSLLIDCMKLKRQEIRRRVQKDID